MKLKHLSLLVVALVSLEMPDHATAQPLVQRSFDQLFAGDDPGELFEFDLPFDPQIASVALFDGAFDNLAIDETGVRFALYWLKPDGDWDSSPEEGFVRLPSYGELPIDFEQQIGFTPSKVLLHIEGGGPADYFQFHGDFTIKQVPEPSSLVLLVATALPGLTCRRFRSTEGG